MTQSAENDAPLYEFEVTEHFRTSHTYFVTARTRQEAVDKVIADDTDFVVRGDIFPTRPINARDAKRLRRVISPEVSGRAAGK